MLCYVLLTYGPKPSRSIDSHPAAKSQLANLRMFRNDHAHGGEHKTLFDYSREIRGLDSLPTLSRALTTLSGQSGAHIFIDNIARLFAVCEEEQAQAFMNELLIYQDHIFGLKQGGLLRDVPNKRRALMATGWESTRYTYGGKRPRRNMSEFDRKHQTFSATLASRKARGAAADDKARELNAIRQELARTHGKPTLKMIADEANGRGLTTTRGGTWTSSTVGRALKRIETSESKDDVAGDPRQLDGPQDSSEDR